MAALAMRAVMAVLTLIYALVAMVSCSVTAPPVEVTLPVEDLPQQRTAPTLRILSAQGADGYALQQAADLFARGRNVTVQVETIAEASDYRAALRARLLDGNGPDLFQVFGREDLLELRQELRPLTRLNWVSDAAGGLAEAAVLDGEAYGLPYAMVGYGLLADRAVFEAAGIPLVGLNSHEALEEALGELRAAIRDGELAEQFPALEAAVSVGGGGSAGEWLAMLLLTGAFDTAEQAAAAGSVPLALSGEVGDWVDLMARTATNGGSWNRLAELGDGVRLERLITGQVALIPADTSVWRQVRRRNEELSARLRLLPIPLGEEGGAVYLDTPAYWALSAQSSDESALLAEEFLNWLYRSEEGSAFFAAEFGALSAYQDTAADTGVNLHSQLLGYLSRGQTLPRRVQEAPAGWTAAAQQELRDYYTVYDRTWEDLVAALRQRWIELRIRG